MLRIETVGLRELTIKLDVFSEGMRLPIARTMREWAEEVMTAAKRVVPVDLGNLMNSGHVQGPNLKAATLEVLLGFGGPAGAGNHGGQTNKQDVGYAEKVHENMNPNIHWQRPGSGPKYLENPFTAKLPELEGLLQAALTAAAGDLR